MGEKYWRLEVSESGNRATFWLPRLDRCAYGNPAHGFTSKRFILMKLKRFLSTLSLLGLLCCGHTAFGDALDNWHWRNPVPNGNPQAEPHTLYGVTFANGIFVGVGDGGTVSISSNATNWTESATATTNKLNGIAYASGLFVAVGDGGAVETSTDGMHWVLRTSGTTNSFAAVAYANGEYVAVGSSVVINSPDAVNWSPATSGLSGATGVAGGSAGFVAVGNTSEVFYSANGSTWTSQQLTAPGSVFVGASLQNSIVTYANGAYLVGSFRYASSQSADSFIFRSTDGNYWTTNVLGNVFTGPFGFNYNFFTSGNGLVIAAGKANVAPFLQFSTDDTNWSTTNNLPSNSLQGYSGTYGNGTFVIVSPQSVGFTMPPIFTSTDGFTWTNQQHPPTPTTGPTNTFLSITATNGIYVVAASNSIARSADGLTYTNVIGAPALSAVLKTGSGFIGVGSGGNIFTSGDGLSWTQRNSGTLNNLRSITAGNGLLVAVGDAGTIQTSSTGTIWTTRSSGTSLNLYGVAYSNGLFVAVGYLGTVLTSSDGIAWTGQDSGQLTNLLSVTYGSAGFVAVGPGGTILTSLDGINWTKQNSGTLAILESITFGNGYYLISGDGAVVLTSPDGIAWTARNVGITGGQNLYGAAFLNSRFDIIGSGGAVIESDVIAPLFDVQIHRDGRWLTAFAPPGTSFRIQTSTNLAAQAWIDATSFNNAAAITQWTNNVSGLNPLFYRAISP